MGDTEQDFLQTYDASQYKRPSVTADIVILTMSPTISNRLAVLLIRRGGHPFQNQWALPGGFLIAGEESIEETARRELFEETGIEQAFLQQLYTFSHPNRDPRTHVLSVAHLALIRKSALSFRAGDDASDARLFTISEKDGELLLQSDTCRITGRELAFDHEEILKLALERLKGRVNYALDTLELLEDPEKFTIRELQSIYEAIKGHSQDASNFRKMLARNYIQTGILATTGHTVFVRGQETMLYQIRKDDNYE